MLPGAMPLTASEHHVPFTANCKPTQPSGGRNNAFSDASQFLQKPLLDKEKPPVKKTDGFSYHYCYYSVSVFKPTCQIYHINRKKISGKYLILSFPLQEY